jgi:hypothetical protein
MAPAALSLSCGSGECAGLRGRPYGNIATPGEPMPQPVTPPSC